MYNLTYEQVYDPSGTMHLTFVSPAFQSKKIQLDSTVVKNYHELDVNQFLLTKSSNLYENNAYLMPTKVISTRSDGIPFEQRYSYSLDNITGLSTDALTAKDNLVTRHIISPALQSETWQNGQSIIVRNNYKIFPNGLPLPESV